MTASELNTKNWVICNCYFTWNTIFKALIHTDVFMQVFINGFSAESMDWEWRCLSIYAQLVYKKWKVTQKNAASIKKQKCLHLKEYPTCLIRVWKFTLPLHLEQDDNNLEITLQQFGDGTTESETLQRTDLQLHKHIACPSYLISSSSMAGQDTRLSTHPPQQANAVVLHQHEELLLLLVLSVTLI